jgi:hypothetical protein
MTDSLGSINMSSPLLIAARILLALMHPRVTSTSLRHLCSRERPAQHRHLYIRHHGSRGAKSHPNTAARSTGGTLTSSPPTQPPSRLRWSFTPPPRPRLSTSRQQIRQITGFFENGTAFNVFVKEEGDTRVTSDENASSGSWNGTGLGWTHTSGPTTYTVELNAAQVDVEGTIEFNAVSDRSSSEVNK